MKRFIAVAALTLAAPVSLGAQQTQPAAAQPPMVVVVSSNKCSFTGLEEVNKWWRATAAPILDDLVRQGRLVGWGVLAHAWGDEWNSVTYYTTRDLNTFNAAFGEFIRVAMQRDPTMMQRISSWCSEHKDNVYNTVVMNAPPPPR